jgi:hypothetical protein
MGLSEEMSMNKLTVFRSFTNVWLMAVVCVLLTAPLKATPAEANKTDPAEQDLKALNEAMEPDAAEAAAIEGLSYPEVMRFADRRYRKLFDLCEAFVNKYTTDPRALQALKLCLADVQPFFFDLKKALPPEVNALVDAQKAEMDRKKKDEYVTRILKAMPKDRAYLESWLKRGDAMVAKVTASPGMSAEQKERAEDLLYKRSDALAHREASFGPI